VPVEQESQANPSGGIVVLADRVPTPGLRAIDHRVADLVAELVVLFPTLAITVVSADWCDGPVETTLPDDVEVVSQCSDWDAWASARDPDLVVVHGPVAARRFERLLATVWSRVALVVDAAALASPERTALRECHDALGDSFVAERWSAADAALLQRAGVVLCASPTTERLVHAIAADAACFVLSGRVGLPGIAPGFRARRDLAFIGSFAEGLDTPDEDAVEYLVDEILPIVRRSVPDVVLHVVGDDLAPVVRALDSGEVRIHWLHGDAVSACRTAAVVVAARRFGRPSVVPQLVAAEAGAPVVEAGAVTLLDAPSRAPEDAAALADALATLLSDQDRWEAERSALASWAAATASPAAYRAVLVEALGAAGLDTTHAALTAPWPALAPWQGRRSGRWIAIKDRRGLGLQLPDVVQTAGVTTPRIPNRASDEAWYDSWHRRRVPNALDKAEMHAAARAFAFRPLISVVTSVYNTDPEVLRETVESVRSQVYNHWELCLADDGSTDVATIETLAELARDDHRIRTTRLERSSGISAASNAALEMANGDYVALLDHDDVLEVDALFEIVRVLNEFPELDIVYSDEHKKDPGGRVHRPAFKPAYSPDLLLATNYMCHLAVFRRVLLERIGGFRPAYDGAEDFDLMLRAVEHTSRVGHVAKPLYGGHANDGSTASDGFAKPAGGEAGARAVADALERRGRAASVSVAEMGGRYRVEYEIVGRPDVAIIIPTRDRVELLRACIASIRERSTYDRYELIVVDNGSKDPATLKYLASFGGRVLRYPYEFHYSRMMNHAAMLAGADQLLFLNNDVEITSDGWLEAMMQHAQRREIGAVGAHLAFADGRPQHEGVFVGLGESAGAAGNVPFETSPTPRDEWHFMKGTGRVVRNFSAVTGACLMIRPSVFWEVGGFDERLHVAFNDVDLGLKLRHRGYEVVCTPYATLTHRESASRGSLHPMENDAVFKRRWGITLDYTDPYNNPNYDASRWFSLQR
jgi:GT2 family glycosyltransferase/glycosyltransferase involved in cell wall biosynthesis